MTGALRMSLAGFSATLVTYGPARMGFGLFLPRFRNDFSLSTEMAGIISSLGFFGFFLGLIGAYLFTATWRVRVPVLVGVAAATSGLALVAAAPDASVLTAGVLIAMSSAGFSWAPFNKAVQLRVVDERRPMVLSVISTGTSLGIAAAGGTALILALVGGSWRFAWVLFAITGAVAVLLNWWAFGRPEPEGNRETPAPPWSALRKRAAVPLYGIAASFGGTTAIYISFAADHMRAAGGLPGLPIDAGPAVMFIALGSFGLFGMVTGYAKRLLGLPTLLRSLLAASVLSLVLTAAGPTSWVGLISSAGLQGIYIMMMSAVMAFWSERLFPAAPSFGFTAVLVAVAAGSVLGPVVAGYAAATFGSEVMFLGTAAISTATLLLAFPSLVQERAQPAP